MTGRPSGVAALVLTVAGTLALVLSMGCSRNDPDTVMSPDGNRVESGSADPSSQISDLRSADPMNGADGAASTNPPLTTALIIEPAPPPSLSGAQATTPTTWPPVMAPTEGSPPSNGARATTTGLDASTPAAPASPSTARPAPTVAPAEPSEAAGVVEFRIRIGTQGGPWNRYEDRVRVELGQILRVHNDDVVPHTVHSAGAPFAHGPTIQPGQSADHAIVQVHTPDPGKPQTYEHDAGPSAPFWVEALSPATTSTSTTAPPTTAPPTTAPPKTAPPTTAQATSVPGSNGSGHLAAAETESLRLLNQLRGGLGLGSVEASDAEMHRFARSWALEMRNTGFRHSDQGRWSENIVWYSDEEMTPAEAAGQFHRMWVDSPGHYRNMTDPAWTVVGIGMWHDGSGWWGVHLFR